jgi:hypothetical protein
MTQKIVLAMVDDTGVRVTGRYRDQLCQYPETETFPEAKACVWSDYTEARLAQVKVHIAAEQANHSWMGYFVLPNTKDLLATARAKALRAA